MVTRTVAVVAPAGASPLEIAIVQQVFGDRVLAAVNAPDRYDVVLCREVPATADTVVIPTIDDSLTCPPLLAALRAAHARKARLVAFGTGVFLLGHAGLLDGRRATTHWMHAQRLREQFRLSRLETGTAHVTAGSVHTSPGGLAAAQVTLHLLAMDIGATRADAVGRILSGLDVPSWEDATQLDLASLKAWLRDHLHEPLTLSRVAAHAYISERGLARKFRQAVGTSVFDWVNRERVARVRTMLESTDLLVSDIAGMVGFGSPETLRRNFEKYVGTTATDYRRIARVGSRTR
ncbi:GlxA family transcriptional regulator [Kutzneria chonburiensis]|uniref:GlxA family transcriptional regulator n=1 Tax=Kutzneria chonburiensis TaxID=1483604 RepID=A0ABV6MP43_9PSEU|nr:helix-turn-helix domain-containing protein [Kutzneria chonburiensis]